MNDKILQLSKTYQAKIYSAILNSCLLLEEGVSGICIPSLPSVFAVVDIHQFVSSAVKQILGFGLSFLSPCFVKAHPISHAVFCHFHQCFRFHRNSAQKHTGCYSIPIKGTHWEFRNGWNSTLGVNSIPDMCSSPSLHVWALSAHRKAGKRITSWVQIIVSSYCFPLVRKTKAFTIQWWHLNCVICISDSNKFKIIESKNGLGW